MRRAFHVLAVAVFSTMAGALITGAADVDAQTVTCSSTTSCGSYKNAGSGPALHGQGTSGYAVRGNSASASGVVGQSASGTYMMPGIEGENTNQTGNDAAAGFGLTWLTTGQAPTYGALGYGNVWGFYGETENAGASSGSYGVGTYGVDNGTSKIGHAFNAGVLGRSTYGTGVLAESNGTPSSSFFGHYPVGLYAVGNASYQNGVENTPGIGVFAESSGTAIAASNSTNGSLVYLANTAYLLSLGNGYNEVTIDNSANISTSGTVSTMKGTYARTAGASGRTLISYGGRTASPQIDDVGQAQLAGGRAFVRLDDDFADVIDRRTSYFVFLTADGDCKGLYVASTGPGGFLVREMQGGRSNIPFQYRIVAKPLDENGRRLAVAPAIERPHVVPKIVRSRTAAKSPEERFDESVGARAYAQAISNARRLHVR